ncbi:hypothetical protein NDU88_006452 [Pleurodeles waltl]|uniref:Uncharacterized protein n=1 Tax=Pleurodeles waltl TaxID=8319 RepID=A0AAV7LUY0_PLEWA|nr:hypothetical protein NDU88_006452 [Pleurodeles waltl]
MTSAFCSTGDHVTFVIGQSIVTCGRFFVERLHFDWFSWPAWAERRAAPASRMETLEEFDKECPLTASFCQLISTEEFEEQSIAYTEQALRELYKSMDQTPRLYERVIRKRKQRELEKASIASFIEAKFFSTVQGDLNRCNAMGTAELKRRVEQLKEEMQKVSSYSREAKCMRTSTSERLDSGHSNRKMMPSSCGSTTAPVHRPPSLLSCIPPPLTPSCIPEPPSFSLPPATSQSFPPHLTSHPLCVTRSSVLPPITDLLSPHPPISKPSDVTPCPVPAPPSLIPSAPPAQSHLAPKDRIFDPTVVPSLQPPADAFSVPRFPSSLPVTSTCVSAPPHTSPSSVSGPGLKSSVPACPFTPTATQSLVGVDSSYPRTGTPLFISSLSDNFVTPIVAPIQASHMSSSIVPAPLLSHPDAVIPRSTPQTPSTHPDSVTLSIVPATATSYPDPVTTSCFPAPTASHPHLVALSSIPAASDSHPNPGTHSSIFAVPISHPDPVIPSSIHPPPSTYIQTMTPSIVPTSPPDPVIPFSASAPPVSHPNRVTPCSVPASSPSNPDPSDISGPSSSRPDPETSCSIPAPSSHHPDPVMSSVPAPSSILVTPCSDFAHPSSHTSLVIPSCVAALSSNSHNQVPPYIPAPPSSQQNPKALLCDHRCPSSKPNSVVLSCVHTLPSSSANHVPPSTVPIRALSLPNHVSSSVAPAHSLSHPDRQPFTSDHASLPCHPDSEMTSSLADPLPAGIPAPSLFTSSSSTSFEIPVRSHTPVSSHRGQAPPPPPFNQVTEMQQIPSPPPSSQVPQMQPGSRSDTVPPTPVCVPPPAPPLPPLRPHLPFTPLRDRINSCETPGPASPDLFTSYGLGKLNGKSLLDQNPVASLVNCSRDNLGSLQSELQAGNHVNRLRSTGIVRSPGGTPVMDSSTSTPSLTFNTSLLTKFQNANSPETSDSDNSGFETPTGTPTGTP